MNFGGIKPMLDEEYTIKNYFLEYLRTFFWGCFCFLLIREKQFVDSHIIIMPLNTIDADIEQQMSPKEQLQKFKGALGDKAALSAKAKEQMEEFKGIGESRDKGLKKMAMAAILLLGIVVVLLSMTGDNEGDSTMGDNEGDSTMGDDFEIIGLSPSNTPVDVTVTATVYDANQKAAAEQQIVDALAAARNGQATDVVKVASTVSFPIKMSEIQPGSPARTQF